MYHGEGMRGETFTQDTVTVAKGTVKTEVKVQREPQGQDDALRELQEEGFCSDRGHTASDSAEPSTSSWD